MVVASSTVRCYSKLKKGVSHMDKYGLKNRIRISNAIDKDLYEELKKMSEETMVPMSKLLDKAIELLLKESQK